MGPQVLFFAFWAPNIHSEVVVMLQRQGCKREPEFVIFQLSAPNSKHGVNKPALELFQNTLNSFFALLIAKRQRQILESEKETLGSFHTGHLRSVR